MNLFSLDGFLHECVYACFARISKCMCAGILLNYSKSVLKEAFKSVQENVDSNDQR